MKKKFYIFSFTVLGAVVGIFVYGVASLTLLQSQQDISPLIGWVICAIFAVFGFWQGFHWWEVIYVHKAYLKWPKNHRYYKISWGVFLIVFTIVLVYFFGNIKP